MAKMHRRFTRDFEAEAVRLVETSGRTQREIADDLGVGLSALRRWLDKRRDQAMDSPPAGRVEDMAAEVRRLRRENEVLRQERDILKRATAFSPGREVDEVPAHRRGEEEFPVQRLCKVLAVSPSGYFAWKGRPACRRQHQDMVFLARIRSAFRLSNGTYGSPRMRRELEDEGIAIGRRRRPKAGLLHHSDSGSQY